MTRKYFLIKHTLFLFVLMAGSSDLQAESRFITIASTTSTENSGLYEYLLPKFAGATAIDVRVVAVGTGKAIKIAEKGDADVLLVHHKPSEERFVSDGFGVERYDVMYNDFVIVGPSSDPAGVAGFSSVGNALQKIADSGSTFTSRGDDSGTHKKELSLWQAAGIDVLEHDGAWYRETGSGMGATLNVAAGMDGYTMTDRSTWLKFSNKANLKLLVEGDPMLFNQYGVILVNPSLHSHIKATDGQLFIDWLISEPGQLEINQYRIEGRQAFFANAPIQ